MHHDDDFYIEEPIDWEEDHHLGGDSDEDSFESLGRWDFHSPETDNIEEQRNEIARMFHEPANTPFRILKLLVMIDRSLWADSMEKSFYEQALQMEDFEDDAPIVPFNSSMPTYSSMTVPQLRSYFTIRTTLRHGQFPDVSLSYIIVYASELLMNIGVKTPEEGYELLMELYENYKLLQNPKGLLHQWLRDYVVYYKLESHFREMFPRENEEEELRKVISNYKREDAFRLLDVLCGMSRYNLRRGLTFKRNPEVTAQAVASVVRTIVPKLEKFAHRDIISFCFGDQKSEPCVMFVRAPFYNPHPVRRAKVDVSHSYSYVCESRLWRKTVYVRSFNVSNIWGKILREIDCRLRTSFNVRPYLSPNTERGFYEEITDEAFEDWEMQMMEKKLKRIAELEAERAAERRKILIDFGKLNQIRDDAEVVKDKLLAGTELEAPKEPAVALLPAPKPIDKPVPQQAAPEAAESKEIHFLRLFLEGGDWRQYLREIHVPEGVMVENINNHTMETIGDIVLEDNGNGLQLIEDYRADIEQMINGK